jgi:hypothetical protein
MISVDGVAMLSLLRALTVIGNIEFKAIYWYISIGTLSLINITLSILGVSNSIMRVMPSGSYCKVEFLTNEYSLIYSKFIIAEFFIMLLITIISYFCITIKYYRTVSKLSSKENSNNSGIIDNRPALIYQRWVIIRLLALVFMYMVCFLPELVVIFYNISTDTYRTPIADSISSMGLSLTVVVNSGFVLFYHKEIRNILASMLPSWIPIYRPNTKISELNDY